jgi:hypothetical protein
MTCFFIFLTALGIGGGQKARRDAIEPGQPVEYAELAFYPERWKEKKISTEMIPWEGEWVVFLTTKPDLDPAAVTRFVRRIDAGWKLYADLTGRSPSPHKLLNGKPVVAAIPDADLTCGYGCGNVGATNIELSGFYKSDYNLIVRSPKAFPHYVFYEMGRNFYTFGDRHSLFVTGYAVFMRYVCMDALECVDLDRGTRITIEKAEDLLSRNSGLTYLQAFTTLDGYDEKRDRLRNLSPSDQPVIYASAMLKLYRECGKGEWLKRFYAALAECPEVKADTKEAGLRQSLNWYVAASLAARRDLSSIICDKWKYPLSPKARKAAAKVKWGQAGLKPSEAIEAIPMEFVP